VSASAKSPSAVAWPPRGPKSRKTRPGVSLQGIGSRFGWRTRCRAPRTLMGLTRSSEAFSNTRSRYSVHGARLVVRRPRGFPRIRQPTPERRRLPWTSIPLQGST
jgi:hypothetical protein